MNKTLYTNGCSWTAGNGIFEDPEFQPVRTGEPGMDLRLARLYTWPEYLGKKLGYNVINESEGGGSNTRMCRMVTDFVMGLEPIDYKDIIIVLGWTTPERDEVYIDNSFRPGWYRLNARQRFSEQHEYLESLVRKEIDIYQRIHLKNIYNHRNNIKAYFRQKFLMANMLENLGLRYMFIDSLSVDFIENSKSNVDDDVAFYDENLEKIKRPAIIADTAFSTFCDEKGLPMSTCAHPLIESHRAWADYVYERYTEIYGK